jgi:hypothetical protein
MGGKGQDGCPPLHPCNPKLVEPEVVATSNPIKSRVPVCCGFGSVKVVGERGLAPPRLTDSRSVGSAIPSEPLAREWCSRPESHRQPQPSEGCALIIELREQAAPSHQAQCQYMEPLAGAAPARFSYKENLHAAAKRQKVVGRHGTAPCSAV